MKKAVTTLLIIACVGGVIWMSKAWTVKHVDERVVKFNNDADLLIGGLQQYKEFTGTYPTGNNAAITKALLGRSDKKVMILSIRKADINDKGEIVDPWGTPVQFYFSYNEVLIRSAGPNKAFEDSLIPTADDLYRSAAYISH